MGSGGSEKPRAHYLGRDGDGIQNSNAGETVAVEKTGSRGPAIQNQAVEQMFWPVQSVVPPAVSIQHAGFRTK